MATLAPISTECRDTEMPLSSVPGFHPVACAPEHEAPLDKIVSGSDGHPFTGSRYTTVSPGKNFPFRETVAVVATLVEVTPFPAGTPVSSQEKTAVTGAFQEAVKAGMEME